MYLVSILLLNVKPCLTLLRAPLKFSIIFQEGNPISFPQVAAYGILKKNARDGI